MLSPASIPEPSETALSQTPRRLIAIHRCLIVGSLIVTCLLWWGHYMDAGDLALALLLWLWGLKRCMALVLKCHQHLDRTRAAPFHFDHPVSNLTGVVYCYCPAQQQYCCRSTVTASIKGLSQQACQLKRRTFDAMVHPDDRAALQRARRLALQRGYFEHTYRLMYGTSVQRVLDRGIVLRRGGKPECHGFLMDISQLEEVGTPPGEASRALAAAAPRREDDGAPVDDTVCAGKASPGTPLAIAEALPRALADRQLRLVYQPQVHGDNQKLAGFEALLRWHHPERGSIAPASFIPRAESMGLMPSLGQWVIEEACRQIRCWRTQGYHVPLVALNISVLQLDRTLLAHVERVLAAYNLEGACLEFEITESRLMQDVDACRHVLSGLRQQGVRLSLDDFGTGYSSLDKLAQLPLDRLKLDRSFVAALTGASHGYPMIEAIVRLAHALQLSVVAEGVETLGQQRLLNELGCEVLQGYLFGAGVEAGTASGYLERNPDVSGPTSPP
ncbi:EAL domain-containing protein [Kushneria sp. AK178]